ncbi:flagellar biosynthesis protein FlhA [Luminiphilus sp.]|jgi:flagellar biosynthesis protein FlhA|nr:flagellar biosynthesis protein FlhA [Luminiphilus sp.]MDA8662666.1 flagellar biosynthesis protein FlhA [Luminiphilus sp.]MDA8815521.1 flagellar biosynthesis protein FlhA [Luminiphilus sp.]MDB2379438.1 flagellar biosynthesis protein FlhA [Luminiphilus sp.]MDB2666912.1 flagellar biosynthesis protein FlhA [Luminiphilus sp.]
MASNTLIIEQNNKLNLVSGIGTPAMLLLMLAMIILPLPAIALDLLFTVSIALAIMVLMAAIYSRRPLDFGVFPTVLLLATLLRLALNVASTRVVLLNGHTGTGSAGKVIEAFGEFVVGGSYAVGLVLFTILVIINFVVVTKGATRVSEVTARFTLDAMPGKQMAIDADLNAGLISQDEALERRERVSRESDFYGAMDGASKFVRGDAVAGILILFINILGGFAIGTLQHGLDAGQAAENYVLLTIGDGLVAQIPSMLLSTATAIIVTRVSGEQDMSAEVSRQLTSNPKVLFVASGIIGVMGLVPGMPNLVFLSIATLLGLSGYQKTVADRVPDVVEASEPLPSSNVNPELSWDDVSTLDSIGLEVGYRLIPLVDVSQGGDLLSRIKGVRKKLSQDLGFLVDSVHIRDNLDLGPNVYRLTIHGVVMGEAELLPDRELAINPGQVFGEVDGIPAKDPSFGLDALWIDPSNRESAQTAGYTVVDCSTVVATHLSQILKNNAAKLVGQDDVQQLLDRLKQNSPKLVENLVPGVMSLADVTRVIHSLLDEGVPIRDMRTIAETLSLQRGVEKSPDEMVSQVRVALGPSIFQSVTGQAHELPVMVLDPQLEQIMGNAIQNNNGVIEPNLLDTVVTGIGEGSGKMEAEGASPVLLVSGAIRGFLARLLRGRMANFYILAYDEIPADKNIRVVTTVGKQSA